MTYEQKPLFSRTELLNEQAAYTARLDALLDRVHSWSYASADPDGYSLEDLINEIRVEAISVRTIDGMLRRME